MLKELFESIVTQAHKSTEKEKPRIVPELSSEDRRRVAFVYQDEIQFHDVPAEARDHTATSSADFRDLVLELIEVEPALIFIGSESVVAILNSTDRRDRVTLPLVFSDQFEALGRLPKSFTQRDAIAFLRRQMDGTGLEDYADSFRAVVFERQQQSAGKSQRDAESMGKSIESRVTGTQDIPDKIEGTVKVFAQELSSSINERPIEIGVDVRLSEELFDFWLPPNMLTTATQSALLSLKSLLAEEIPNALVVRGLE